MVRREQFVTIGDTYTVLTCGFSESYIDIINETLKKLSAYKTSYETRTFWK